MRVVAVALSSFLVACSPLEQEPVATRHDAIIGGAPTGQADPEVFALLQNGWPFCSATLIHPRVLLTAAHCVDGAVGGVTNDPDGYPDRSPPVRSTWAHPDYARTHLAEYDLGLVLLRDRITWVTPKPIQRAPLVAPASGRAVGYGQQSVGGTPASGERRTITLPITAVTTGQVRYGMAGAAICFGDSGGPFFATLDGVERQVAVHSYTNDPTCSGGAGARVDANRALLDEWFAANVCARDGACEPDCPVEDFDCTCAADGQCTAACTRPEFDPDCPANCGADGVCASRPCPMPDGDCRAAGVPCERGDQCLGQRCTSDPQHADSYCSMACTSAADCAALEQAECHQGTCRLRQVPTLAAGEACMPSDRCVDGTRCHFVEPGRAFCARPCSQQSDCAEGTECRFGISSWKACVKTTPPVSLSHLGAAELPAAPAGCATVGSSWWTIVLAVLLTRRAPRR